MSDEDTGDFDSIISVSEGAGFHFVGMGMENGLKFITNVILTRTLGATLYGIYAYLLIILSVAGIFSRLGSDKSLLRFVPEYEDGSIKQHAVITIAYGTCLASSILVSASIYLLAPTISKYTLNDPLFVDVLRLSSIVIPFDTLSRITFSAFKSIERMEFKVLSSSIIKPLFRLFFVGGAVLLGYSLIGAVAGLIISSILILSVTVIILLEKTHLGDFHRPSINQSKKYYNFSLPLLLNQFGTVMYKRVDLIIVGILLTGFTVGIYKVAIMMSGLLALPLQGFNQLFPPVASRLYQNGRLEELESLYSTITRWGFTLTIFPAVGVSIYSTEILQIFGQEFTAGTTVLILFIISQLIFSIVGPAGFLLIMTDHQYFMMILQISFGIINIVSNIVLITIYGFVGAAIATATTFSLINITRIFGVWYFEGFFPYTKTYYKPITASIIAGLTMLGISNVLGGYRLIIVGFITGGTCFIGSLYYLGFEEEETIILSEIINLVKYNIQY